MMMRAVAFGLVMRAWAILGLATLCFGLTAADVLSVAAEPDATPVPVSETLAKRIQPLVEGHAGDVGVAIKSLSGDGEYRYRDDQPMATASLIKLPLMVTAYQQIDAGQLDVTRLIELSADDQVPGSGILTNHFSAGLKLPLVDAIRLMITYSDNTATNLVAQETGLTATATAMEAMGLDHTKLHSKVFRRDTSVFPERSKRFGLGSTSAADMITLLERLHRKEIASESSCEAMIEHLLTCDDTEKMPAGLPPGTRIAHKTGSISSVRTDAGIVYGPGKGQAFAICVLTENNRDKRWVKSNEAHTLIARVAKEAYESFYGRQTDSEPSKPTTLQLGAYGDLVEAVQRTLNARMTPSPSLSVDGDYGPMTQSAVMKFQESKQLKPSGVVDRATFAALGTLIDRDEPAPAPLRLNENWPEKAPADALEGIPFVTAKAWAMVDANTGERIAGDEPDQPRPMASTTKLMTAMVVNTLAGHDDQVWNQTVTFSSKADNTIGSTAAVRAGESLSVRELMYGLMLPSGNDASVAFAEHFGSQTELLRLAFPDVHWSEQAGYDRFIQAMNRLAEQIGMNNSTFVNPHGLTEPGHQASAHDLAKLAVEAMNHPVIRETVSTPQYGCTVKGAGGYLRNVAWYNTNRLLKIEGYQGVKTGTTSAAGACLIAHARRDDRSRILVVLGSSSSDARYTDARNLFRWGWIQHP